MHVGERHGLNAKDSGRPNLRNSQNQAKLALKNTYDLPRTRLPTYLTLFVSLVESNSIFKPYRTTFAARALTVRQNRRGIDIMSEITKNGTLTAVTRLRLEQSEK